jgi:hypothetical protein
VDENEKDDPIDFHIRFLLPNAQFGIMKICHLIK